MKKYLPLIVIGIIVLIIVGWFVGQYNGFVRLNEDVDGQWAQVETRYQERFDLVDNLVNIVTGIADQEQTVLLGLAEARSKVGKLSVDADVLKDPEAFASFQAAQSQFSGSLSRLLATVENYPELKSSENFLTLQAQLEGIENMIAVERMRFNDTVKLYNVKAKGIPGRWLVSMFGFDTERLFFDADEGSEDKVEIKFDL